MPDSSIQFHETELGNRYLLDVDPEIARKTAEQVLATEIFPAASVGGIRHSFHSHRLDRMVTVTMGNYDDEEVHFRPASGSGLARLILNGIEGQ